MVASADILGSLVLDIEGDRLEATFVDDLGNTRDRFTLVKNTGVPPQADFMGSPRVGVAPLTVAFTDLSTTNTAAWTWDLDGDGLADSTQREPTFVYTSP